MRYARWEPQHDATIRKYSGIKSAREIADLLGRSMDSVKKRSQKIGVNLRRYGDHSLNVKISDAMVERIRQMRDDGVPVSKIHKSMNLPVSRTYLYAVINYRSRIGAPAP